MTQFTDILTSTKQAVFYRRLFVCKITGLRKKTT